MMNKDGSCPRLLCPFSLGVAFGIAKALCMLAFAWAGWLGGYGVSMIHDVANLYYGFAPTFVGGLYGALWGLIGGFIFGFVVGLIYDCCASCCAKKCGTCCGPKKSE